MCCSSPAEPLTVVLGSRIVDVRASLQHSFDKMADENGNIQKYKLNQLLEDLELSLNTSEMEEALMAFPESIITFRQFETWWIGN